MSKPFEEGFDIIFAGIKRENEDLIKQIYYFGVPNGLNDKYKSLNDFKEAVSETPVYTDESAEEIMEDIENMFADML